MIISLLIYAIVFFATFICLCIYRGTFIPMILSFEIIYFCFSFIQLIWAKLAVKVELDSMISVAECGKPVKLAINVKGKSKWHICKYKAKITFNNKFEGEKLQIVIVGNVSDVSKQYFQFTPRVCGKYEIKVSKFYVMDLLGFMRMKKKANAKCEIGVLPETNLIPLEVSRYTREYIADAEEYSNREAGDDPSELYQIREYREGDSLHDIHWKLSAKENEYMIKEKGKPLGAPILIKLDMSKKTIRKKSRGKQKNMGNNNILNIMSSIVFSLYDAECICMVSWYDEKSKSIEKVTVRKEEDLYLLLNRVLFIENYKKDEYVEDVERQAFRGMEFSTVIDIDTEGNVKVNNQKINIPKRKTIRKKEEVILWKQFVITV